ncbi:hypothetical protein HY384_00250 [Candidatus Daviesbacteria bacterium]|nr:hypothetical protein [Candidatus Daviesbacteria bacterium]
MILTVSVSELRNNLSSYLTKVTEGNQLLIKNGKKKITIAQISKIHSFDKNSFKQTLLKSAGVFTVDNHPEWATKKKVIAWLRKTRLNNQRFF